MNYQKQLAMALSQYGTPEEVSKAANPINTSVFSANGGLSQELADRFIDLVVDEGTLLKAVSLHKTASPSGERSLLNVIGNITEQATESGTSTQTRKPINTKVPYAVTKTRSNFDITGEVAEDTIEGTRGSSVILNALIKHVMNDMEQLSVEGDASLGGSDDQSRLLKSNDGWNVQMTLGNGAHIKDAGAKRISLLLMKQMLQQLPTKWRRNLGELRWFMSPNTKLELTDEIRSRATTLGDTAVEEFTGKPWGIPIFEVPLFPENLSVTGTDSTGTILWLTKPSNLVYVVQRDLKVHQDFRPRTDTNEITAFMRTDFIIEVQDMIVKANNLVLDPGAARFT